VVTIDMRHTPFFGWIKDLSAPDPTAIGNLFGLLGGLFTAEQVKAIPVLGFLLGIGILPVLYGFTMWGVQSLSPPPPDEMQRKIFAFMPLIFVFLFAGFAAGLVIYWLWSNILTLAQQYVIMRRQGVETEFDKFLAKRFPKGGGTGKA
jgi:YidC/Oxa1 family membrane protein insertase